MNLEEIKAEWVQYNQKLENSQRLNEQILLSMLKERSKSRVAKIRQNNAIYMFLMIISFLFVAAILTGNPFDFKYSWQYIPYEVLAVGVLLAIISLIKSIHNFSININNVNLDVSLKKIIDGYERNKKIERLFGILIITAGTLTAFSFLPNKLEHKAMWPALGETALSILITLSIYFIAFKSGAFKNGNKEEFENDLKEWKELKNISSDLTNDNLR